MRRVIGIDPGLNKAGWGIIEVEGNINRFIASGTIVTNAKSPLAERLKHLNISLSKILDQYQPEDSAIEETFVNKNPMSSLKLGHARGALMVTLAVSGLPISEYSATKIKKSIVGTGRADKNQIGVMVKILLPNADFDSEDAADALATAICHAHHGLNI